MSELYTADGVIDKNSLWQRYAPLVRHEALRLQVRLPASVELDDLLQAGGIGLLHAVERYDAMQGTAFTTYAVQRIRGAMLDELRSRDWVPRSVRRNAREVSAAMQRAEQRLHRAPTETEIAQELDMPLVEYQQILLDTNTSHLFLTMNGEKSMAIAPNRYFSSMRMPILSNSCWKEICASA